MGSLVKATRWDGDGKPPQKVHNTYLYKRVGYFYLGSAGTKRGFKRALTSSKEPAKQRFKIRCRLHQVRELPHCCCFFGKKTQPNSDCKSREVWTPAHIRSNSARLPWPGALVWGCCGARGWLFWVISFLGLPLHSHGVSHALSCISGPKLHHRCGIWSMLMETFLVCLD